MNEALKPDLHDKPRGHKLDESKIVIHPEVDLSGILVQTQSKTSKDTEPMPERLLHVPGFVHEVSQFSLCGAPHPNPQMATLGALACQSFLVSRKVRSELTSRPSVYLLALASSGTGKDFPRLVNQFILTHIGMGSHIVDACASGEGLEDLMVVKQTLLMPHVGLAALWSGLANKPISWSPGMLRKTLFMPSGSESRMQFATTAVMPRKVCSSTNSRSVPSNSKRRLKQWVSDGGLHWLKSRPKGVQEWNTSF